MIGKTLVHEFHISYILTEWYLLALLRKNVNNICIQNAIKLIFKLNY